MPHRTPKAMTHAATTTTPRAQAAGQGTVVGARTGAARPGSTASAAPRTRPDSRGGARQDEQELDEDEDEDDCGSAGDDRRSTPPDSDSQAREKGS